MSKTPSPRNSPSPQYSYSSRSQTPSRYSSSRSPSPVRTSLKEEIISILADDLYFKISIIVFIVLTCITLSFSFPENDPKTIELGNFSEFMENHKYSMQTVTQILFVLSFIYIVSAYIIRRN